MSMSVGGPQDPQLRRPLLPPSEESKAGSTGTVRQSEENSPNTKVNDIAAMLKFRLANETQKSKITVFFENIGQSIKNTFQPKVPAESSRVSSDITPKSLDGVKETPKPKPHVDMAKVGKGMEGIGLSVGSTILGAGIKINESLASGDKVGIAGSLETMAAASLAGAALSTAGTVLKTQHTVEVCNKADEVLKTLKTEQKQLKNQLEGVPLGEEDKKTKLTLLDKLNTQISAIEKQKLKLVLTAVSGNFGTAADITRGLITTIAASSAQLATAIGTQAVPILNLVQQFLAAPLNIFQMVNTGIILTRVNNDKDLDLAILNKVQDTEKAAASKKADETKKADAAKDTQEAQKTETAQKPQKSIFETIRSNIQKVMTKEVSDKSKAVVGTAIGITIGCVALAAAVPVVGLVLLGVSLAIGVGYMIFQSIRSDRHKEKVDTNKTALNTIIDLAKKDPQQDQGLTINKMLTMSKTEIDKVLTTAKQYGNVSIKDRVQGGLSPKYETKLLENISSDTVKGWITDIKGRDENTIDDQIKEFYKSIKDSVNKDDKTKEDEINALCRWISKSTSIDKGNEAEVKLWLEGGFDGLGTYKSPFDNLLELKKPPLKPGETKKS